MNLMFTNKTMRYV